MSLNQLFTAQTTNASSATAINVPGISGSNRHQSASFTLYASGTFGGGTVSLEASPDEGTTWFDIGTGLTAKGAETVTIIATQVRAKLAGSTAANINAWVGTEAKEKTVV